MVVYRVGRKKFSKELKGEGARLHGGRWNHILFPCIYTSESRALAVLDYTVNISIEDIPQSLCITAIEIPDTGIHELNVADFPRNWKKSPAPASTKDLGSQLLKTAIAPIIKIPSIIIPQEFNYILNPKSTGSKDFKIINVDDFVYDARIKLF
ncbi:MAG: RES domain-containing protein [Bacteroidetes bacterium]|nr:RES domain-containing protein [Bacteroidota bacterium]